MAKHFFLLVLTICFCIFVKNVFVKYIEGSTTFTTELKEKSSIDMPTLTFCNRPSVKPSILEKYGYKQSPYGFYNPRYADLFNQINDSYEERFYELSYVVGRDFEILFNTKYEGFEEVFEPLEVGMNVFDNETMLELQEIQSLQYGLCYALIPKLQVLAHSVHHFVLNYSKSLNSKDFPKNVQMYLSSQDIYKGRADYTLNFTVNVSKIVINFPN